MVFSRRWVESCLIAIQSFNLGGLCSEVVYTEVKINQKYLTYYHSSPFHHSIPLNPDAHLEVMMKMLISSDTISGDNLIASTNWSIHLAGMSTIHCPVILKMSQFKNKNTQWYVVLHLYSTHIILWVAIDPIAIYWLWW